MQLRREPAGGAWSCSLCVYSLFGTTLVCSVEEPARRKAADAASTLGAAHAGWQCVANVTFSHPGLFNSDRFALLLCRECQSWHRLHLAGALHCPDLLGLAFLALTPVPSSSPQWTRAAERMCGGQPHRELNGGSRVCCWQQATFVWFETACSHSCRAPPVAYVTAPKPHQVMLSKKTSWK